MAVLEGSGEWIRGGRPSGGEEASGGQVETVLGQRMRQADAAAEDTS